jgi:hypothetical protein
MAWSVGHAVCRLVDSCDPARSDPAHAAANAIRSAYEAVARFEEYEPQGEDWATKEHEWQEAALRTVERGGAESATARERPLWLAWLESEWGWEPSR